MKTTFYQNDEKLRTLLQEKFIHFIPGYFETAVYTEENNEVLTLTNGMDCFEFFLRHYTSGINKTLHRVMYDLRLLKSTKGYNKLLVYTIVKRIERDILEAELYELMPRLIKAKKKIEREINENS